MVVDLDGTLIARNSFRLWMRYLLGWSLRRGRLPVLAGVGGAVALRALRLCSHADMKSRVLRHSEEVPAEEVSSFAGRLAASIRPEIRIAVAEHAAGRSVVLVTAAPDLYLSAVADAIGADEVIGTPSRVDAAWSETVGEQKWTALVSRYEDGVEIEAVFTDHRDDLPLVRRANRAFIVNPTNADWELFVGCGTPVTRLLVAS